MLHITYFASLISSLVYKNSKISIVNISAALSASNNNIAERMMCSLRYVPFLGELL